MDIAKHFFYHLLLVTYYKYAVNSKFQKRLYRVQPPLFACHDIFLVINCTHCWLIDYTAYHFFLASDVHGKIPEPLNTLHITKLKGQGVIQSVIFSP